MKSSPLTRREILRCAALGTLALPLLKTSAVGAEAAPAPAPSTAKEPLRLGVATYSTRDMTLDDTISALKALRITNAGLYKKHCDWETVSVEQAKATGEKLRAAGIALTGSGVVNLTNDEAKCRKAFENVKAAGMATMICKPDPAALPLVEKLAKEYDQKLALHNHGPEDKTFPTPQSAFDAIKSLDARIGLCIDVGHTMRAHGDPAAEIRKYAARLYDLHLKDSAAVPGTLKDIPVEMGAGTMNIRAILQALLDIKYTGVAAFEYEKVGGNPVIGLAESVGHVRGLLRAMTG